LTAFVATTLVFVVVGVLFLMANLVVGRLVRPNNPSPEKDAIYECGEEPIGTAWIQFDLRFYVVALLFVIFDVEIAFFFPWAVVFGDATKAAEAGDATMGEFAKFAFVELVVFFAILLVGFAYLWKRGDLEWVKSTAGQPPADLGLAPQATVSRPSGTQSEPSPQPRSGV
jgi:NADH-quinone oxidoreductase subunit A